MSVIHEGVEYPDWEPAWVLDRREGAVWLPSFGEPVRSFISMSADDGYGRNGALFFIPNAGVNYASDRTRAGSDGIQSKHPWARDDEGDRIYVVQFQIDYLTLVSAWPETFTFRGLLIKAEGWDPSSESPFDGIEREEEDPESDWYANVGFPYTPPRIQIGAPRKVIFDYQSGDHVAEWWEEHAPKFEDA
jgi:hypothetical protein